MTTDSNFYRFASATANIDNPGVEDIEPKSLWEAKDKVTIIDVRRPDEFSGELGHIPGAKMVVLDTLPDCVDDLPADQTIVFVCRSGGRSGRAAAWAREEGMKNVYNMRGGMLLWNELGLPRE